MNSAKFFTDFDPYCETIAHADLRMRVLGMEAPRYSIVQTAIGQLGVQWAQEGSGQLSEGSTDRSAFGLYMQLNSRPRVLNGMPLDPNAIVVMPPERSFASHAIMQTAGWQFGFQSSCWPFPEMILPPSC